MACAEKTNCVAEEFYKEAIEYAIEQDKNRSNNNNKESNKILEGVPISFKDQYCVKGYDATSGLGKTLKMI